MSMAIHHFSAVPVAQGLYDPQLEKDACGVAMVATLTGQARHDIVALGLTALRNMEHRGASGAEPDSGDGAGILIRIPDRFFREVLPFSLPESGSYGVGITFLPASEEKAAVVMKNLSALADEEGLTILGWRELPINSSSLGATAKSVMPSFKQIFLAGAKQESGLLLDRLLFCFRKRAEHSEEIYFPSLSTQTLVYKGMLTTGQLEEFFPELSDERVESPLALVHSRFSTNTFLPGRLPTHIVTLHITAKSILLRAIEIGCALEKRSLIAPSFQEISNESFRLFQTEEVIQPPLMKSLNYFT